MGSAPHADYYEARLAHRWDDAIPALGRALRIEARNRRGGWAWRILPSGIVVALRRRGGSHLELRISRREAPTDDRGRRRWEADVRALLRELGGARWERGEGRASPGVAAWFVGPAGAETADDQMTLGDVLGAPSARPPSALAEGH